MNLYDKVLESFFVNSFFKTRTDKALNSLLFLEPEAYVYAWGEIQKTLAFLKIRWGCPHLNWWKQILPLNLLFIFEVCTFSNISNIINDIFQVFKLTIKH